MHWLLTAARRLRELGVLGMNRRNAACILDHNPRSLFPVVDDKLRMRDLCLRIGVPTPEVYGVFTFNGELRTLDPADMAPDEPILRSWTAACSELKSAVVAGPTSAAGLADLLPIETIRAFLKAHNIAPAASAAAGIAGAKPSVVRVICVRK